MNAGLKAHLHDTLKVMLIQRMTIERARKAPWFMCTVIGFYIATIVVANGLVTFYGQVALPFTSFALIPFDLIARDILQDRWQDRSKADLRFRMTIVIMSGALISVLTGTGSARINLASFLAFIVAGAIDALTYQWMIRYGRIFRINGATLTAAITDSIIFVLIAFDHAVWSLVLFQIIMKVAGGFCWSLLLYRFFRKSSQPVYHVEDKGCWEAVADEDTKGESDEFWRVRWSIPDAQGRYFYVRHYGGNGTSWNRNAAQSQACEFNEQHKGIHNFLASGEFIPRCSIPDHD